MADGIRTRDHRDHNPGLYQLSYRHRAGTEDSSLLRAVPAGDDAAMRHTRYGWWLEDAGPVEPTAPLEGDATADVVVVGAGYLGLWTAWQLRRLEPALAAWRAEGFRVRLLAPDPQSADRLREILRDLEHDVPVVTALLGSESIGDALYFCDRAVRYTSERQVFGRPIGQNQGVQFPIARAYVNLRAADLMRFQAADLFDQSQPCGAEANMAKLLAADAAWEAANVALQTFGGFGFAREYDIERKFRETRLYQVAPISTNLVLSYVAQHVLGLPRSY